MTELPNLFYVQLQEQCDGVTWVKVIRCKDCTHYQEGFRGEHWCTKHSNAYSIMQWSVKEDDYCSWGERKEDE